MEKATRQQTKEQNRNLALKLIFDTPSISRAEIARLTHLTRTTVSDIVADLLQAGLVNEIGPGSSIGGKSPILLSLAENARHLIGLDLAYDKFSGAVVNLRGQCQEVVCKQIANRSNGEPLQVLYEILDQLVKVSDRPLAGIGVGTPGLVNTKDGVVIHAVNLDWTSLPLGQLLRDRYRLPVYVLNDCQAAAMGEYMYGSHYPSAQNMIVIRAGQGIGAGIILNGQLFQGEAGGAGEIGHVVAVRQGGLPCRCGNLGCLETVASARAVIQRAEKLRPASSGTMLADHAGEITLEVLDTAFRGGDPLARQIILEAGRFLGMAVSSLVGALNIHKIILMGEMTRFGQPWLDAIRETMSNTILARLARATEIQIDHLEGNEVILGASALLANNYSLLFKQP